MSIKLMIEADAAKRVREMVLAAHDDEGGELVQGMIEGETSFVEMMDVIVGRIAEEEGMASAIAERIKDLAARKSRYEARKEALRKLALDALQVVGISKLPLAEATLSISAARQSVVIIDEELLPDSCVKLKRTPDKTEIAAILKAGGEVAGATLSNGGETLTIRSG